jgi:uncharacterized membrane protein SpoIIM required for sporulation
MREVAFIKQNKEKWIEFEKFTKNKGKSTIKSDELSTLYIQLMNDLSFAQTYYPKSKIVNYLNQLATQIYVSIYKTKRTDSNRLVHFFKTEVPLLVYQYRTYFYATFILFFLFLGMGILSAKYDNQFVRLVLGDDYVNQTLENIKKGDAVAIYKSGSNWGSFIGITMNNLFVGIRSYFYGLFCGFGSAYSLFMNTIMLGSFQYFFYDRGVLLESVKGIWIHGSMEIFAMIIEAACGIVMGFAILFPGTYTRLESFKIGFRKSFKIFLSTFPFTLAAGFLEGYITRFSNVLPTWACFLIIFSTLGIISFYYLIYPFIVHRKMQSYFNTLKHV